MKLKLSNDDVNQSYLPALDGLRGIAIGLILLHHCFGKLFSFCWIGVDLFFVLSGFLITRILLNTRDQKGYLKNFYMRRVLRIFPLYYVVLFVMFVIFPLLSSWYQHSYSVLLDKQVWYWTYTSNWLNAFEGWLPEKSMILTHFWSLAIEEQYYLFWPFIVLWCPVKKIPWIAIALIVTSIALRFSGYFNNPGYYVATVTRADGLLLGSILAWLTIYNLKFLQNWTVIILLFSAAVLIAGLAYTRIPEYSNPFMVGPGYTILALFFFSIITVALQRGNGFWRSMLQSRVLLWLGKYSYGLYVLHYIVYWGLKDSIIAILSPEPTTLIKVAGSVVCVILTMVLALISYHFMEAPFLKLKKHFTATS